jgi:mono/diheme cytochrome c family protein
LVLVSVLVLAAATRTSVLDARQASGTQDAASSGGRSILDGVFTSRQASRGREQFQRACTSCHTAGEHTGRRFAGKWQGSTMGDVFDLVSTTMPEGDPGSLAPEEYASILAFFLSESGYKEGEEDLPFDLESLQRIRIEPPPR